jgi:membrane-bound lytic murein transglycosylase A
LRALAGPARVLGAVLAVLVLAACAAPAPPDTLTLTPTTFDRLPGWRDDAHGGVMIAFRRSCARLSAASATAAAATGPWRDICGAAERVNAGDRAARDFFENRFVPHLAANNGESEGLFTGYYEAELRGAPRRKGRYRIPIYARPADLVSVDLGRFRAEWKGQRLAGRVVDGRLVPFPTRAQIRKGALKDSGLELLWVDDPVDAFFLHVQGSGRVIMDEGPVVRLGYAATNGHPYVSIGKELIARGAISRQDMSMQSIRAWLRAHPGEGAALMATNPSFIFFRPLDGAGPIGAEGVPLTPGRSLAVDTRFVSFGVPVWLDTTDPLDPETPLRRLVIAQDTGGAIKGPVRGDLFWGFGAGAAERAGHMKQTGRYYLLLPK